MQDPVRAVALSLAAAVIAGCGPTPDAQRPAPTPVQRLETNLWATPSEFTVVSSVRVLSDGRMIVADVGNKELHMVSAGGATITPLGRTGDGPGEYREPRTLLPLAADSTLLLDPTLRRFMVLAPDGTAVRTFGFPTTVGAGPSSGTKTDAKGTLYFASTVGRDSFRSVLLRWRPGSASIDTLGTLEGPKLLAVESNLASGAPALQLLMVPYTPSDGWTVSSSGDVTIIRGASFTIERPDAQNSLRILGTIAHTPIRVSDSERDDVTSPALRESLPQFKAPFVAQYVYAGANGHVWVPLTPESSTSEVEWAVLDSLGALAARIQVPADARIVWIGHELIVLTRRDSDGLVRLEGYQAPDLHNAHAPSLTTEN